VNLAKFRQGRTYRVNASVGRFLVDLSSAEEISSKNAGLGAGSRSNPFLRTRPNEVLVAMVPRLLPEVAAEQDID
jgi:hypothetical protein